MNKHYFGPDLDGLRNVNLSQAHTRKPSPRALLDLGTSFSHLGKRTSPGLKTRISRTKTTTCRFLRFGEAQSAPLMPTIDSHRVLCSGGETNWVPRHSRSGARKRSDPSSHLDSDFARKGPVQGTQLRTQVHSWRFPEPAAKTQPVRLPWQTKFLQFFNRD